MEHGPPNRDDVLRRLADALPALRERFGVTGLRLFGSVGRDEAAVGSDVDVLVDLERPLDLFRFDDLEHALTRAIGHPVDLVEPGALHPALRDVILREAVRAA